MNVAKIRRVGRWFQMAAGSVMACSAMAWSVVAFAHEPIEGRDSTSEPATAPTEVGPRAALAFEKSFRALEDSNESQPVRLDQCENITGLTKDLWSKKHVLTDFKQRRSKDEIGVIVIVKTEYCCTGSRLCAVTTASLEKKSTPLMTRFRVYAGWIKNNPDHAGDEWNQWEQDVIREYDFIQGLGARLVVMVPTWDGRRFPFAPRPSFLSRMAFPQDAAARPDQHPQTGHHDVLSSCTPTPTPRLSRRHADSTFGHHQMKCQRPGVASIRRTNYGSAPPRA